MTNPDKSYDAIILGAGAAGLFCAITAAKNGNKILVIEKSNKVGKKILMSGGGRCNFTNHEVNPEHFVSNNIHFCKSALSKYSPQDFIKLVQKHDIQYETKKHGQLFCTNSSKDIVNMLLDECSQHNITIVLNSTASNVKYDDADKVYSLLCITEDKTHTSELSLITNKLVVATGALSVPTLGGSSFGYELAKEFDLEVTELRAGLVPFMFSDFMKPICERLSGVSHRVEVSSNNKSFTEDILFTHRGLSGPAILQISSYWNLGDFININLFPDKDIENTLNQFKLTHPKLLLRSILTNLMPKALVAELEVLFWPDLAQLSIGEWSNKKISEVSNVLSKWEVKPSSTEGYRTAEVTMGGVDTKHISSQSMEVNNQNGLYFIGEVLDVTGHLGGFNFQWAWASAFTAGQEI